MSSLNYLGLIYSQISLGFRRLGGGVPNLGRHRLGSRERFNINIKIQCTLQPSERGKEIHRQTETDITDLFPQILTHSSRHTFTAHSHGSIEKKPEIAKIKPPDCRTLECLPKIYKSLFKIALAYSPSIDFFPRLYLYQLSKIPTMSGLRNHLLLLVI